MKNQSMNEAMGNTARNMLSPHHYTDVVADADSEGNPVCRKRRRDEVSRGRGTGMHGQKAGQSETIAKARNRVRIQKRSRIINQAK